MIKYKFVMEYITLPDNRRLIYYEYGIKEGNPVFYFHGSPSSGLEPLIIGNDIFAKKNIRLIAPNRPGIGYSNFQTNRGFSNWPQDVLSLADKLGIGKFSILGNSGGGGYVTVCAAKIPERLNAAVTISGGWQINYWAIRKFMKVPYNLFWITTAKLPFLLPLLLRSIKSSPNEPKEKALTQAQKMMHPADYDALLLGDRQGILSQEVNEALTNTRGAVSDLRLYVKPWDFNIQEVQFPITFLHGEEDRNFPIEVVRKYVSSIKKARFITFKNEAHLSTLCNHITEALAVLTYGQFHHEKNQA